jgi:Eukaryotic-type carbonic anhydrase
VAIFLESGNSSDHYDFLDLYIQKWMEEERRILDHCHVQRNATTNTRVFRRKFTPYDWLKKVATEYYFRYEGSQTVPPCFSQAVHWRVMKDSIRVAPQQIQQLEQLIARRMNPSTCRLDTAGAIRAGYHGKSLKLVDVNRPLQITYPAHKAVFCECSNWESKIEKDRLWCKLPREERGVLPHWKEVRRQ